MKCAGEIEVRDLDESCINIDPIQVGGRLTPEAMKAVIAYGDGYSVCDHCRKPFRLDFIKTPPVDVFFRDLAAFLHMDVARVVPGARRGFQAVVDTCVQKDDPVLITALSHYTEVLAIEARGGLIREIPKTPENLITPEAAAGKIESVIRETGKAPSLLFIDQVDYQYGNLHPVRDIAKVAHQYDIPVLVNGAYTVGIMDVNGKDLGADFLVGSGHKSMASPAPSGVLAATAEWATRVFRTTAVKTDVTSRTFGIKEVEMMGCTLMGVTLIGMMASFPRVRERVKRWDDELANGALVVDALRRIEGTEIRSEYPRKHTLTRVDTTRSFDMAAKNHKKRGYFLSSALRARGIAGTIPGATKVWKFNTYGMTRAQAGHVASSLIGIAEENGLSVG
ncbi:MAG: O-phospho-L-seryl-tRNA:Cys-tRNA synthase [Methanoregulaceae archaeon PtaB.Bin056]|jgi:Sep-tRNA:Cys-tRNA synthetase|nr:MAG: O-phospho-L-seryl-tRNA:Cys-tRNA synthase [Methanoregulaceae archaeon PtaB.Bin056]